MEFIASVYTGAGHNYNYQVSKIKGGWIVTRWGINGPRIPPLTSQLNDRFEWVNILTMYEVGKFAGAADAFEFLRSQSTGS